MQVDPGSGIRAAAYARPPNTGPAELAGPQGASPPARSRSAVQVLPGLADLGCFRGAWPLYAALVRSSSPSARWTS